MRTSGSLERNGQWQRRRYRLARAVRLGNGHTIAADADAVVQRRAWVQMIALGELQVDEHLPSCPSLDLLRCDLDDFVSLKIGATKASHGHWRCQAPQGERRDLASCQVSHTNRVVVGVGYVQFARRKAQTTGLVKLRLLAIAAPGLAAAQIG